MAGGIPALKQLDHQPRPAMVQVPFPTASAIRTRRSKDS
jgi:hypothetical protein